MIENRVRHPGDNILNRRVGIEIEVESYCYTIDDVNNYLHFSPFTMPRSRWTIVSRR